MFRHSLRPYYLTGGPIALSGHHRRGRVAHPGHLPALHVRGTGGGSVFQDFNGFPRLVLHPA